MSATSTAFTKVGDVYRGRSVFLTGHTGFKGSWLALWLTELGARVHGYALPPPTTPSLFEEARIAERLVSHVLADVRDADALQAAVRGARPEFVFHLAAQPLVRRSYREPRETFETNVLGTVNLLEAVRSGGETVRVCQVITSDKCYANDGHSRAFREDDPMGGHDPYSASKGCAELVVSAYRDSYFAPPEIARHNCSLASVRAGNVIGGGDWAEDRIIPDCVRALTAGHPIAVRNPRAVRPWQHVLEPLGGYLALAARQAREPARFADSFNFGPVASAAVTVGEVVQQVISEWGSGRWVDQSRPDQPAEAGTLQLDVNKADKKLGWRPLFSVSEAISRTIYWYRRRLAERWEAAAECLTQIREFQDRMQLLPVAA